MSEIIKTFTIEDIRSWNPCYDPSKYLPEEWNGNAIDILKDNEIPSLDKLWVICRESIIDAKTLRLFAVWCSRQVEHLMTDKRSKIALKVAEDFANGLATREELDAAWTAANAAARAVAWTAVNAAAWTAANAAAWTAASDAAKAVAWTAVNAASDAASAAANAAAWTAASDAAKAATCAAARATACDAQIQKLIEMLKDKP